MRGPAAETIDRFGAVEDDQRYTRLVELFTDDAVYYDPFYGPQRGQEAIRSFMEHMEQSVPASGGRFEEWTSVGDTHTGWATWVMAFGDDRRVPGQSLYRLRDGMVCAVADYVDPLAYAEVAGPDARRPDLAGAAGLLGGAEGGGGPALDVVRRFWSIQDQGRYAELAELFAEDAVFTDVVAGRFDGSEQIRGFLERMQEGMPERDITFELVDAAGEDTVAWSQWTCHLPAGSLAGWTLHTVSDGRFTLDADHFDTAARRELTSTG